VRERVGGDRDGVARALRIPGAKALLRLLGVRDRLPRLGDELVELGRDVVERCDR
jgi:hypothetical protein